MVGVPERQHTAASLNKQLFRSQHTSQDDGHRVNVAPHRTSLRFLGLCCSEGKDAIRAIFTQACSAGISVIFFLVKTTGKS